MSPSSSSRWFRSSPHDNRRSVDLVRIAVAIILLTHPLHAFVHPDDLRALAAGLAARGLPFSLALASAASVVMLAGSIALLFPRFVVEGAIATMAVLAGGAALLYAPRWYVVGGSAETGHPGVEHNVLLLGCLAGVLWTYWPRPGGRDAVPAAARVGLDIIRICSALAFLPHGSAFVTWDVAGMRAWGDSMTEAGFPCGVALVWSIKSVELVSALLRLARRFMVPACLGHLSYLVPALWIEHEMHWFVLGPGENGIEFALLLVVCSVACLLAYWPTAERAPAREQATSNASNAGEGLSVP